MDPIKDLIASLATIEFGGMTAEEKDEDITKQLANHYLALIRTLCKQYTAVSLDASDLTVLRIDGCSYNLDLLISHDDRENRKHLTKIKTILTELTEDGEDANEILGSVQEILNA